MMSRKLLFLFLLMFTGLYAQEHARVYFTDKPNVSQALANPSTILTPKAVNRKIKFSIPITETDVPVNEAYINQLKAQPGISVKVKSKWFNMAHVIGFKTDVDALLALPFVSHIEYADRQLNTPPPAFEKYAKAQRIKEVQVNFNYGTALNQVQMMGVDALHQQDFTGEGITIGVMDSGFNNVQTISAFQRLRVAGKIQSGFDFVDRTADVFAFTGDDHGTQVLSAMGGFLDGQMVGTAPDASYYLFRTEDIFSETPVEESYWVAAAERADSLGVDLLNTSLGYSVFDESRYNYTPADMDGQTAFITKGANIAFEKGMLVVNSAGNSGNISNWQIVTAPADGLFVLAIGAVNSSGGLASFSSRGPTADGRIKPEVVAQGVSAVLVNETNSVVTSNGTSFSAPLLSGAIGSLWQANPQITPAQMLDLVKQSGSNAANPNNNIGYGIPDFLSALQTLSLAEFNNSQIKLFPNPFDDLLNIQLGFSGTNNLQIFDMLGRLMLSQNFNNPSLSVDVSHLPNGLYLAKIGLSGMEKTYKIVKK